MGAAFGSGASGSLFGASGSANFLSRTTAVLAAVFFVSSLGLTYLGTTRSAPKGVTERSIMDKAAPQAPDVPSPSSPAAPSSGSGAPAGGVAPPAPRDIPK
jgi:preprotein translocase subunit SecG